MYEGTDAGRAPLFPVRPELRAVPDVPHQRDGALHGLRRRGPSLLRGAAVRAGREHGGAEYCFQCTEYPCARYTRAEPYDSFVPHRNVQRDFARAARDGLDAYRAMLEEKEALLRFLLREYNDGRRKSLFCTAVNLLELADVRETVSLLRRQTPPDAALREKGALAARLLQEAAAANGSNSHPEAEPEEKVTEADGWILQNWTVL